MTFRRVRFVAVGLAVASLSSLTAYAAGATRAEDLRSQAKRIAAQISANGDKIAALGERYNGTLLKLDQIHAQQVQSVRDVERATRLSTELHQHIVVIASRMYMQGNVQQSPQQSGGSYLESGSQSVYAESLVSKDRAELESFGRSLRDLREQQQRLRAIELSARRERDALNASRRELDSANRQEQQLLARVQGELGDLILQEQAARLKAANAAAAARAARDEAAARAAKDAATKPTTPVTGSIPPSSGVGIPAPVADPSPRTPASNSGVAAVIAYARQQLGKPYVFNTAGPNTFDCSGLTMMAWAQAGVAMPHYSGSQFSIFPHVALSQLQPGDLVFHGRGGADHVALYVGGGMQIAATHTGSFVKLQPVPYGSLSGAVRPN